LLFSVLSQQQTNLFPFQADWGELKEGYFFSVAITRASLIFTPGMLGLDHLDSSRINSHHAGYGAACAPSYMRGLVLHNPTAQGLMVAKASAMRGGASGRAYIRFM
jgi:hypothetical protein